MARLIRTEAVPIGDLRDFPGNARRHDREVLDESVLTHGQYRAVVARELPDGSLQILAGHGTRDALARAGHDTIDVEVRDVPDDAQARRIVAMDNAANDRASYVEDALLALLDQINADPGGLTGSGFSVEAYEDMSGVLAPDELDEGAADTDDDDPDLWPVLRVKAPVRVLNRYRDVCSRVGDAEDHELLDGVLDLAERALDG